MENLWKTFDAFGIYLEKNQIDQLKIHFDLLMRWKEVHNLTTIDDPKKILLCHYIDSILGLKALEAGAGEEIYDLGSGAGFPGLVAAVLWPNKMINLVETSKKKCSFLRLAASSMGLNRVKILDQRVEALHDIQFAITRAAFSPGNWSILDPAIAPGGQIAFWLSESTSVNGYEVAKILNSPAIADVQSTRVGLGKVPGRSLESGKIPLNPPFSKGEGPEKSKTAKSPHWVLDNQSYYELEPGHRRQIAVFRKI